MCLDSARVDQVVDWAFAQYNVQFPSWVVKIFTKVMLLFSVDGVAIFSDQNSLTTTQETNIANAIKAKLGAFDITKDVVKFAC